MKKPGEKFKNNHKNKSGKALTRATISKFVGLLFVSPWIIGFFLFTFFPILQMIEYSVNNVVFRGSGTKMKYVGLKNFTDVLFVTPDFRIQAPAYLRMVILLVPMILVFSVLLATLLNLKIRCRGFLRAVYFLPVILLNPPMLNSLFQMEAFNLKGLHDFFVFAFITGSLPPTISSAFMFIMDNIIMCLWLSGVQLLIFLSGMQKVDSSIYEAAVVDGASAWQKFWKITIPTLKPFILLNAVYTVIDLSTSAMNPITNIIMDARYRTDRGFGFAAATAWLYFAMVIVLVGFAMLIFGRGERRNRSEKEVRKQAKKIRKLRKAGGVNI